MPPNVGNIQGQKKFWADFFPFILNLGEIVPDVFKLFCPSEPDFTPAAQKKFLN